MDEDFKEAQKRFREHLDKLVQQVERVAADLDKTLVSVSAGALVFSTTLVNTFAPDKRLLPLL